MAILINYVMFSVFMQLQSIQIASSKIDAETKNISETYFEDDMTAESLTVRQARSYPNFRISCDFLIIISRFC